MHNERIREIISNSKPDPNRIKLDYIKKDSYSRIILYGLETLAVSLLYFWIGLGGSALINTFICQALNPDKSKLMLFLEASWETVALIFWVYLVLWYIPTIPSVVPFPDTNHNKFKRMAESIVVAAVVFAHERLLAKFHHLVGVDNS
jgi:hypothetical protein